MMRIKRYSLLLVFCLAQLFINAQTTGYHYQAVIDTIEASGFYNILMTPAINSHLKTGYSDLRIINDSGKWIPYVSWAPNSQIGTEATNINQKVIKKENNGSFTDIIIEASDSNTYRLIIELKNSLAERYCTLTGSDDLSKWFIINDSIIIRPRKNDFTKNSDFTIEFPPVNYKYFRIHINNNGREPFNILGVSSPLAVQRLIGNKGKYFPDIQNPPCMIMQKDSGNYSYLKITQTAPYHFYKIGFKLSGAKYYKRNAGLYFPATPDHSFSNPGILKESFVLSNNSTLEYYLPASNPVIFYLVIQNEDNPPLKVEAVKTYMDYVVATAWLEKNNHYKIIMANESATLPNFDLKLEDIEPNKIYPDAVPGPITALPQETIIATPVKTGKQMIWLFIGIAVAVLAFFTWKLISDMNKAKT